MHRRSSAPRARVAPLLLVVSAVTSTFTVAPATARADVKLPAVISSHMVLQQQSEVAIWGFAEAGEVVTVTASFGATAKATADAKGRWRVSLKTPAAGGPHTLDVKGKNELHLEDILIGEVWLCGGQSNMEWAFSYGGVKDAEKERAAANDPQVRLFDVPNVVAAKPADDCVAQWAAVTPESVNGFSCVGWFFARELRKSLNVPVGLIGVNWGGTVAQAWVSKEALAPFKRFAGELAWVDEEAQHPEQAAARQQKAMADWWDALAAKDLGVKNGWGAAGFDDGGWEAGALPGIWSGALANFDGVVWCRRAFELPAALAGQELALDLGPVDDMDTVWIDGVKVGGMESPGHWNEPRHYRVPASLATAGRHVLALRVVDTGGGGGMGGEPGEFALHPAAAETPRLELAGECKLRVSMDARELPAAPASARQLHANVASVLFNGLVAPVVPFGIRGALWYQGESNRGFAAEYADLMPALIADWRARFGRADFPFLFVQIAPFNYGDPTGKHSGELRQAQLETLRVKNAGMAVTMDIGDPANIHPADKQEVGRRLSLWALAQTYGKAVGEYSGPLHESMAREGSRMRVRFTHATGGLVIKGGAPSDFEILGADGKWRPAKVEIDGASLLLSNDAVSEPKDARYGYSDAGTASLFNGAGLPASPFCKIAR